MNPNDALSQLAARQAAMTNAMWSGISIVVSLIAISIVWYGLGALQWEKWVKNPRSRQALILRLALAVWIGYQVSQFLISYMTASASLKGL